MIRPRDDSPAAGFLERAVRARLADVREGVLRVRSRGREEVLGRPTDDGLEAVLDVRDPRTWRAVALRGSVGAGEAYADGWWDSPEPTDVARLFARNQAALEGVEGGLARLSRPLLRGFHALRANSRRGARRNVSAHYDLSNEFFRLFLDPTMTYSSGVYEREDASLREAQLAKIDRLCAKLRLRPEDHLLEIGTGWGALAVRAAERFGCRVTTTTLSREQASLARERVRARGLDDRVQVLIEDFRDLEGRYDKVVSVEMIEAIGHRNYPSFFAAVERLLRPDGAAAVQAITIHDRHYDRARRSVDFIQRHVFPGSCIPSVTALLGAATENSDLRLLHHEDFGGHYARTLRAWRDGLRDRRDEARALGFDERFLRLWDFYFCYCEGGFLERHVSVAQMLLSREGARSFDAPLAPLEWVA